MKSLRHTKLARGLLIVGVVVSLPSACAIATWHRGDDASVAFTPITRLSLDSVRQGGAVRARFSVPDTPQWTRIRQSLGDLGYIAMAADRHNGKVIPWGQLGIELTVRTETGLIPLTRSEHTPYAYSSDTKDVGLRFKPLPRNKIEIGITTEQPERLPDGELIIEPFFDGYAKDFLVGASLESDLRPFARRAGYAGVALLVASIVAFGFERSRPANNALEPSADRR